MAVFRPRHAPDELVARWLMTGSPAPLALRQAALGAMSADRTCVVVAHRLSTVRDADAIYVLENGQVVERGRFDELVNAGGLFARLARAGSDL